MNLRESKGEYIRDIGGWQMATDLHIGGINIMFPDLKKKLISDCIIIFPFLNSQRTQLGQSL